MKTILFILTWFPIFLFGQPSCHQDSIGFGNNTVYQMDSSPPECWQFCSPTIDSCHYIRLPDSSGSCVLEFKNLGTEFEIVILSQCRWVVHDTCAVIENQTPGFVLFNQFPPIATLMLCGGGNDSVAVMFTQSTVPQYAPFGVAIVDIDTICGVLLSVNKPIGIKTECIFEFDGIVWRKVDAMLPNRIYKRW